MIKSLENRTRLWLTAGAGLAALAVILGAFGAHGLESVIQAHVEDPSKNLMNWETGCRYQMYHSLSLILVNISCCLLGSSRWISAANVLFVVGIVLFSFSLYVLALTDLKILGAIVPLGGLAFILGWTCFATATFQPTNFPSNSL